MANDWCKSSSDFQSDNLQIYQIAKSFPINQSNQRFGGAGYEYFRYIFLP